MKTSKIISAKDIVTITMIIAISFALIGTTPTFAASCYGTSCEGLNPNTMGCSAIQSGAGAYIDNYAGFVETRLSYNCFAEWARTTNTYTGNMYLAASYCYGGAYYNNYFKNERTPAAVSNGEVVYTPMHGQHVNNLSCGRSTSWGPLSLPVTLNPMNSIFCTGTN